MAANARPRSRSFAGYLLALPSWLILGGGFVLPLLLMLLLSFARRSTYGGIERIDDLRSYVSGGGFLANYARSLEPIYLQIYWRSLWLALLTTAACLLVSYPIAYYLAVLAPRRIVAIERALDVARRRAVVVAVGHGVDQHRRAGHVREQDELVGAPDLGQEPERRVPLLLGDVVALEHLVNRLDHIRHDLR